jgi:hypothetical protein
MECSTSGILEVRTSVKRDLVYAKETNYTCLYNTRNPGAWRACKTVREKSRKNSFIRQKIIDNKKKNINNKIA